MRKPLILALLFAAIVGWTGCGATLWKEPKVKTWSNATGAEAFERLFWQEIKAGNWGELEKRVAVSFAGALASGPVGREALLAGLRGMKVTDYAIADLKVQPAGADMVVHYTVTVQGPAPATLHVVSVWQKVEKDWTLIAHSQTPAR